MADRQFVAPFGSHAAPADWPLPASLEILLRTAYAKFNGVSAAGSYRPCLRLISDSGHVVAECVSELTVAAGASADVSWFPGADLDEEQTGTADYNTAVLNLGPWAYWKLNEPAGTTTPADSSGHGRTLSTADSGGSNTFGQPGLLTTLPSQTCDLITHSAASNQYPLETLGTQTFSSTHVSLEAWVKTPGGTGHDMTVVGLGRLDTEQIWWLVITSSGQLNFSFIDSGAVQRGFVWAVGLADNLTHHIVVVWNGSTASAYVDGTLISTQAGAGSLNVPATKTAYIGQNPGGAGSRMFQGDIGPVVVYDTALTAPEVATLYNQGSIESGGVTSVTAGDTSIVAGGTATDVTLETASLDVIAGDHPTAANWSNNSHKITGVTEGAASGEAATYAATPAGLVTAKGDLLVATGSHVAARLGVGSDTNVLIADSSQSSGVKWGTIGAAAGVSSVDGITGAVTLAAGANIAITDNSPSAGSIKITASGSGVNNELDYVQITSSVAATATTDATATALIDGNAVSYDGSTRVKIEVWAVTANLANNSEVILNLYDGSTDLGRIAQMANPNATGGATGDLGPIYGVRFLTPSNGSHTFHIKLWKANANGASITAGAGGTATAMPAWYRITTA